MIKKERNSLYFLVCVSNWVDGGVLEKRIKLKISKKEFQEEQKITMAKDS